MTKEKSPRKWLPFVKAREVVNSTWERCKKNGFAGRPHGNENKENPNPYQGSHIIFFEGIYGVDMYQDRITGEIIVRGCMVSDEPNPLKDEVITALSENEVRFITPLAKEKS